MFAKRHEDRRIVFENQAVRQYAADLDIQQAMPEFAEDKERHSGSKDTSEAA